MLMVKCAINWIMFYSKYICNLMDYILYSQHTQSFGLNTVQSVHQNTVHHTPCWKR